MPIYQIYIICCYISNKSHISNKYAKYLDIIDILDTYIKNTIFPFSLFLDSKTGPTQKQEYLDKDPSVFLKSSLLLLVP